MYILTLRMRISKYINTNMILMPKRKHLTLHFIAKANLQLICIEISTTHLNGPSYATI